MAFYISRTRLEVVDKLMRQNHDSEDGTYTALLLEAYMDAQNLLQSLPRMNTHGNMLQYLPVSNMFRSIMLTLTAS